MERIIELVRKYPILYDLSHEDYKNVRKKDKVWSQIGEELGENGEEIKKKWRNLRDTFAKYIKSTKTKTEQAATNTKKWIWADEMEGFRPFLNFAKTTSNVQDISSEEYTEEIDTEHAENEEATEVEEIRPNNISQNSEKPSTDIIQLQASTSAKSVIPSITPTSNATFRDASMLEKTPFKRNENRKRKPEPSSSVQDLMTYFDTKKRVEHDATDKLFLAHAATVKTFSARRQIEVKMKVARIIMEYELLQLEENTSNNSQTRPASTDTYRSISSVESTSLDSPNDAAFNRQLEVSSEAYQMNSGPIYTTLTNQAYDISCQPASRDSSTSNYLNNFNPYKL